MNPFDLLGPDFLVFYLIVAAVVAVLAAWLRWHLRQPTDPGDVRPSALSPYHLAYLADGPKLAMNAAAAALVQQGALGVGSRTGQLAPTDTPPQPAHPLEGAVHAYLAEQGGCTLRQLHRADCPELNRIHDDLERDGLLVAAGQRAAARAFPLLLLLSVAGLGVIKILVGVSRGKSVAFLVVLVVFTVLLALGTFARRVHRSRRGDKLLEQARSEQAALRTTAHSRPDALPASELSLAVALFGVAVLSMGPLVDLRSAARAADSGGGGGGCGGADAGGGGGCGGGGCGGGGCGGGCGGCGG
jgi:uncharacterized protein (TIGR04222 family)